MSSVVVMAGTRKGAFFLESDEDRTDWTVRGPALKGWEVSDVVSDDRVDGRMFAAVSHFVYGPTIHRSDDRGETWEQVEGTPSYPEGVDRELEQVWCVEPGRADEPDVLYAGVADAGLFVSRDGGDQWEEVLGLSEHETRPDWVPGFGGLCCHSILQDPTGPDRLWVGISAAGVFRTEDGGDTWTIQNAGLPRPRPDPDADLDPDPIDEEGDAGVCVHRMILDPTDPDRLFQQNHVGIFRSTDGADTWERIEGGLPSTFGFPIAMHPRDPDTLYVVPVESDEYRMAIDGEPAVYRTTDAGETWTPHSDGLPADSWVTVLRQAMATDELDRAGVYVGTTGGRVFYSRDEGETWDAIDCHLPRILSLRAAVLE